MKKILLSVLMLLCASFAMYGQTARVQIIHNSPTPTVDIWANSDRLLDDFAYRTATPYVTVPAGVLINIGVALANSQTSADAIATFPVTFESGKTYIVVATGTVGGNPGFTLAVSDMGRETAPADQVSIAFFHGTPDAPEVDITAGGAPIFDNVSYGEFANYVTVPAAFYELELTPGNDNNNVLGTYFANVEWWRGNTMVVVASGFLGGQPDFQPFVVLSNGGTFPLGGGLTPPPPPPPTPTARVQIIHNSPTPTVDIWAGNAKLLDDFAYRTATPFIDVPSGVQINIGVALRDSDDPSDALANFPVTFEQGKTYVVIATGIVGGNPGFDLSVFDMGQEKAPSNNEVGILFFHGSPDAPEVDIIAGGNPIFDNVQYGEFSGYINVPAATYRLGVTPANDNSNVVASYDAPVEFWRGNTMVVFASGFFGGGDPGFVPYVALSNGGTFPLPLASNFKPTNGRSVSGRMASIADFKVFPNPTSERVMVSFDLKNQDQDVQLRLFNGLGQLVRSENLGTLSQGFQQSGMELGDLTPGNYILQVLTNQEVLGAEKLMVR